VTLGELPQGLTHLCVQLPQDMQQGNDDLVPKTGFTEGPAAQHAAQVALLAVLHHDVQLRAFVHSCPERHHCP
jgi:hypothetical protein